jgi:hypothetical protein
MPSYIPIAYIIWFLNWLDNTIILYENITYQHILKLFINIKVMLVHSDYQLFMLSVNLSSKQ